MAETTDTDARDSDAAEKPTEQKVPGQVHEVAFVAYPKLLFIWPLLLAGFVLHPIAGVLNPEALEALGWVYLWVVVAVVLVLAVDIDRNQAIFLVVLLLLFWVGGKWLADVKSFTLFGNLYNWFAALDVQYNRALGLALSIILTVPFVVTIGMAYLNDRWRITHNEFEHHAFGKMDDSLGRGAKTIRTSYPDMLELLLGLAGTLVVYSANGTKELRRIPHVIGLPMVRKRLNTILESTAITVDHFEDEEEEDE